MFVIWYVLFSTSYLFVIALDFFFCKILKLDKSLFNILFSKIDYLFNFYSLVSSSAAKNTIALNSNQNSVAFKNLYAEFIYFNKNAIKSTNFSLNSLKSISIFCSLNTSLFIKLPGYSNDLNYISYVSLKNLKKNATIKKINLNFFFNMFTRINGSSISNSMLKTKTNVNLYFNFKKKLILKHKKIVLVAASFKNKIDDSWVVKFSPSNFIKYINSLNLNKYNILYLRKAKVFNKGRYSRNRQYYRTGVYWCLYVNIIAGIGIYFWFYRFTMNFGYLWWLLYIFISSFIIPKAIKYRFYNIVILLNSIAKDLLWLGHIVSNTLNRLKFFSNLLNSYFNIHYSNFYYFYLDSKLFRTKRIIGFLNLITSFIRVVGKGLSIFSGSEIIHRWEFNNINYYYSSVIKSSPVFIEKFKQSFLRLLYIIFLSR